MANLSRLEITKTKPIGEGLNDFHDSFNLTYQNLGISSSLDSLHQIGDKGNCQLVYYRSRLTHIELKNLIIDLVLALQNLPTARLLPSSASHSTLRSDLLRLLPSVNSDNFNIKRFTPLLKTVLNCEPDEDV
jgi:hypothetical protein